VRGCASSLTFSRFSVSVLRLSIGVSRIRGSCPSLLCRMFLNPFSPIFPIPMCSCLSSFEPKPPLESFRWTSLSSLMPITSSNRCRVCRTAP